VPRGTFQNNHYYSNISTTSTIYYHIAIFILFIFSFLIKNIFGLYRYQWAPMYFPKLTMGHEVLSKINIIPVTVDPNMTSKIKLLHKTFFRIRYRELGS